MSVEYKTISEWFALSYEEQMETLREEGAFPPEDFGRDGLHNWYQLYARDGVPKDWENRPSVLLNEKGQLWVYSYMMEREDQIIEEEAA